MALPLKHLYLLVLCIMLVSAVPLVPRAIDRNFPIPIAGMTWHEILDCLGIFALSMQTFITYYAHLQANKSKKEEKISATKLLPIILSITLMIEGHGIHWSCNAIHRTFNPGNEWKNNKNTLYTLTYFLDEILGHFLLFAGIAISCLLLILIEPQQDLQMEPQPKTLKWYFNILLFYSLSIGLSITMFAAGVEGQCAKTVIIPWCIAIFTCKIQSFCFQRSNIINFYNSTINFFCICAICALLWLMLWGYLFGWHFPEFRVLGLGPFSTWIGQFIKFISSKMFFVK
ncbi:hypothetical protein RFI_23228 [Reticulomyxa filosa]|uniref:Transmembrane protein n=1 Tax=Reticulomyxa filosa TaxID=46433 RepID=X6MM22_RETFI|nr:hypothetical protein RFI_23228 [Reticulomyxa filosa]|eukprot:ETO14140.1 hypothetical protein RFI_23228 [Reticulomyxa filosa]